MFTDNFVITNTNSLPFRSYLFEEKAYNEEGFYHVKVGPVVCESGKTLNTTFRYVKMLLAIN